MDLKETEARNNHADKGLQQLSHQPYNQSLSR
jgi:hypothetical protein